MSIQTVHEHIDSCRDKDLQTLIELVRIPSIASRGIGIEEACDYITGLLGSLGVETQVYPTKGAPVIFGRLDCGRPGAKTVMFYGHYDVQPPEPLDKWLSDPFEPDIRDGRIYGRGVGDNKGQFLAHILAVRSYLATGTPLPVNIKFFIEGEEEAGSRNILDFIVPHRDLLDCDLVYNADGGQEPDGRPSVHFGTRGMADVTIELKTAEKDNHSGHYGNNLPSAAWRMVKLLSTFYDENGDCAIEGFYDDVLPPTEYEKKLISELDFDPEGVQRVTGAVRPLTVDHDQFHINRMFKPTFNLNGLASGYTGPGHRTIVTGSAIAKFDFRLVKDQDPQDIIEKIKKHVAKHDPDARVVEAAGTPPSRTDPELPACKAVVRAVERAYGVKPVVMPTTGATNPEYVFTRIAGLPSVCVPYCNADESQHAPNENFVLENFYKDIHCTAEVLEELGKNE